MDVYQILFLFVLGSLISSYTFYPKMILRIARGRFPRILSKVFITSIALITFIFGIHSDIFSSYDKNIVKTVNRYNWFSPKGILEFPIEQYKINNIDDYPENIVNFEKGLLEERPTRKVTILLDKTASVTYNVNNKRKEALKKSLVDNIDGSIHNFKNILNNSSLKIEDLFVLTALEKLTRDEPRDLTQIQVIIYLGSYNKSGNKIADIQLSIDEEYNIYNKKHRSKLILKCLEDLIKLNSRKSKNIIRNRFTDFYGIAKELNVKKFLGDGQFKNSGLGIKYEHTSLFILSDFMHENDLSERNTDDVAFAWSSFGNLISQINLISFDTRHSINNKKKDASSVKELFKKNFNHLYFFEFDKNLNNGFGLTEDEEINVMFSTVVDGTVAKPIILYHSWDKEDYRYDYKGEITIKKEHDKNLIVGFLDRIRPSNYVKPYTYLSINRKPENISNQKKVSSQIPKLYENQKRKLKGSEKENYLLSFSVDEVESKNFSLEFTYPHISYTVRHPIVFKPVLSTTSNIYLIILYFLLVLSMLHGSIYFMLNIFKEFCNNRLRVIIIPGLLVLSASSIWLLKDYYIHLFFISRNDDMIRIVIVSSFFLLLSGIYINYKTYRVIKKTYQTYQTKKQIGKQ